MEPSQEGSELGDNHGASCSGVVGVRSPYDSLAQTLLVPEFMCAFKYYLDYDKYCVPH